MSLDRSNFDDVVLDDLQELVASRIPESLVLEFKRDHYDLESVNSRKELAKDVSALANTAGGHLIIGMRATEGVANALIGIEGFSADRELLRMEQILQSGLEPRVYGLRTRILQLETGNRIIVIRVPKSYNPPHRVVVNGINRFYLRNSAGCFEASVEDLRTLFTLTSQIQDKIQQYVERRLHEVEQGPFYINLARNGGIAMIHITPFSAFTRSTILSPESIRPFHGYFQPPGAADCMGRVNFDGYIFVRPGEPIHGYTQVFRNGIVEATKTGIVHEQDGGLYIQGNVVIEDIVRCIKRCLLGLRELGVNPPLSVHISLLGVSGATVLLPEIPPGRIVRDQRARDPIMQPSLHLPLIELTDNLDDLGYDQALKPSMDAFVNAVGEVRCSYFNAEGRFTIPMH